MNKKSIEQEAEELYPYRQMKVDSKFNIAVDKSRTDNLRAAYIAAATKYSEQQRQVIADTWDAALKTYDEVLRKHNLMVYSPKENKEEYLNNLFPSEIKGDK